MLFISASLLWVPIRVREFRLRANKSPKLASVSPSTNHSFLNTRSINPELDKLSCLSFLPLHRSQSHSTFHYDACTADPLRPSPRVLCTWITVASSPGLYKISLQDAKLTRSFIQLYLSLYLGLVPLNETIQTEIIPVVRRIQTHNYCRNKPEQVN